MEEKGLDRVVYPWHHDGHGLNDLMQVYSDMPDDAAGGGAAHRYRVAIDITGTSSAYESGCTGKADQTVAEIQFQHGPRHLDASTPGCTEAVILAVLIDRYRCFQKGPFACPENAETLEHIEAALAAQRRRADERAARGVLGRLEK